MSQAGARPTRLAYVEIHPDETAATCATFLHSAPAWGASAGIDRIERVMTGNAMACLPEQPRLARRAG